MKKIFNKKWSWVVIIIAFVFLGIQFIRPQLDIPIAGTGIVAPDSVKNMLRNSCYDCHSNETRLAWFDKIAPANWLVISDIRQARKVLNFSDWANLSKDRQRGVLFESLNHIQFKTMPLKEYTFLHPAAKIGTKEISLLQGYLHTLLIKPMPDTAKTRAWNEQYTRWIGETTTTRDIKPSPNGIAFMPGYKNWVAVSATERSDDGRLRIITGNEIAVNAIKTNHTNPWPDGSAFAKIAWIQVVDSTGNINAGEFKQVAFMIKDKVKYKSTGGWGYAQWEKGIELVPYGKNALFTTGCVNCHKPMKENDFVFTMPLDLTKEYALEDKVISSSANKKLGTMSTLYGNESAVNFARTHTGNNYPAGAVLTLVTWIQKEDAHWFGANIPDAIKSIEKLRFSSTGKINSSPVYELYGGDPLAKIAMDNPDEVRMRLNYILSQRASVMP